MAPSNENSMDSLKILASSLTAQSSKNSVSLEELVSLSEMLKIKLSTSPIDIPEMDPLNEGRKFRFCLKFDLIQHVYTHIQSRTQTQMIQYTQRE